MNKIRFLKLAVLLLVATACGKHRSENESVLFSDDGFSKAYVVVPTHKDFSKYCGAIFAKSYSRMADVNSDVAFCLNKLPDGFNGSSCLIFPDKCYNVTIWNVPSNYKFPVIAKCSSDMIDKRLSPEKMQLSEYGTNFIAESEGFVDTLRNDATGNCNIGYGHLVHYGACDGSSVSETPFKNGISKEEGKKLFAQKVKEYEQAVKDSVTAEMTQAQYDAVTAVAYNVGADALERPELKRLLNNNYQSSEKPLTDVGGKLTEYSYGRGSDNKMKYMQGLNNRRLKELSLYYGLCVSK